MARARTRRCPYHDPNDRSGYKRRSGKIPTAYCWECWTMLYTDGLEALRKLDACSFYRIAFELVICELDSDETLDQHKHMEKVLKVAQAAEGGTPFRHRREIVRWCLIHLDGLDLAPLGPIRPRYAHEWRKLTPANILSRATQKAFPSGR